MKVCLLTEFFELEVPTTMEFLEEVFAFDDKVQLSWDVELIVPTTFAIIHDEMLSNIIASCAEILLRIMRNFNIAENSGVIGWIVTVIELFMFCVHRYPLSTKA